MQEIVLWSPLGRVIGYSMECQTFLAKSSLDQPLHPLLVWWREVFEKSS
jgi:hypothetical protein